ncbi:MAG: transcription antitermination factor NusB [Selenomonadaceae bacterium]|nr:transcription antitermination factor NusB [Selenomonadaceae bacterium]MBP3722304.1 transcription antitermination factor NusB [Selenomonadaceae bacterium]
MSRRAAREVIFKTLFELDLNSGLDQETALQTAKDAHQNDLTKKDNAYIEKVLRGVTENLESIDSAISAASTQWKLSRMGSVDRAILRLAAYEMKFLSEELTANIVMNEAIELAKIYGTDESKRFINGVLGGILKK